MAEGKRSSPFKVRFERTGGFAAVPFTLDIDSLSLSIEQADKLHKLIEDSDFFNLASISIDTVASPDRFAFIIMLEMEGIKHTVMINEDHIPPRLKPFIDYLTGMTRRQRSNGITPQRP